MPAPLKLKRSSTTQSTLVLKDRSSSIKRAKLSAPTSFPITRNKTEAKNNFDTYTPTQILSGDIWLTTYGGVRLGTDDYERNGKAITQRYSDIRWRAVSASTASYLSYRVIVGIFKQSFGTALTEDWVLEGTNAPANNILRAINGKSSEYAVILHDKYYHGTSPVGSGAGGVVNPLPVDQVVKLHIPYTAQQVYSTSGADSANNWTHFIMVINAPNGQGLDFRVTTDVWYTDA